MKWVSLCNNDSSSPRFCYCHSLTNNYYLNVDKHYVQNTTILPGQVKVTQVPTPQHSHGGSAANPTQQPLWC